MIKIIKNRTEHQKGVVAIVFLALVFASMGVFARYLSADFLLLQQVYLRVLAAFLLSLLFFRKDVDFKKLKKISIKEWGLLLFRAAAIYLLTVPLITKAIIMTKYSNVSFISGIPLVAVLGIFLLGEKLTSKKFFLLLAAFLGVLLISMKDYSQLFVWGEGELFAFLSAFAYSLSCVARKWHSHLLTNKEITVIIFFLSFLLLFITSLVKGDGLPVTGWHWGSLFVVLVAGLFNVMNLYLANYGFQKVEAILASNILTLESAFGVIIGFLFYKEVPIAKELIGGIVITLSVIGMNKVEAKE